MSKVPAVKFHRANTDDLIKSLVVDCKVALAIDRLGNEIVIDGVWTPYATDHEKEFHVIGKTISDALQKAIKEVAE